MNLIDENVISADELNRLYPLSFDNDTALSAISGCRGGVDECGSILWADCREILGVGEKLPQGLYNIFGHTQLRVGAIIQDSWACLDFRQAFVLQDGVIKDY